MSNYRRGSGYNVFFNPLTRNKVHKGIVKRLSKLDRELGYLPTGNSNEWKIIVKN